MRLWGLRNHFTFGVIRCLTEGVLGRKLQTGNFHKNFRGPRAHKLWVRSEKVRKCKNGTDVLYVHAKFAGDRWTHADRRWKTMLFFVCMFVMYVCHGGCPGWRSGRSTTFNVTVCRAISMSFSLFFTERNDRAFQPSAEMSTISIGGATMFDGIGENLIFKNWRKS